MNVLITLLARLAAAGVASFVAVLAKAGIDLPAGWADEASVAIASAVTLLAVKYGDDAYAWAKRRLGL